jgi:hypothetical protein
MAAGNKGERGRCGDLEEKGSRRADATGAHRKEVQQTEKSKNEKDSQQKKQESILKVALFLFPYRSGLHFLPWQAGLPHLSCYSYLFGNTIIHLELILGDLVATRLHCVPGVDVDDDKLPPESSYKIQKCTLMTRYVLASNFYRPKSD